MPAEVSLIVALLLGIVLAMLFIYLWPHPASRSHSDTPARHSGATSPARAHDLRELVETSPDTITRYDRECHLIYANATFRRLEKDVHESAHRYGGESFDLKLQEVMESCCEDEYECAWETLDGLQTRLIRIMPELDTTGKARGAICIGRDISALKETETRLRESRDLLRALSARRELELRKIRKELANEMHEDYGQRLSALRMNLATLPVRHFDMDPELAARLNASIQILDQTIASMRQIVSCIHPPVLNMSVATSLDWLAGSMLSAAGVHYELKVTERDGLLDEMATNLVFRLVQNALSNVVCHAHARSVRISLEECAQGVRLEVRDDGRGFDLDRDRESSLGLVAMEELALMLDGEIVFLSGIGKGTVIEVCFPASQEAFRRYELPM